MMKKKNHLESIEGRLMKWKLNNDAIQTARFWPNWLSIHEK